MWDRAPGGEEERSASDDICESRSIRCRYTWERLGVDLRMLVNLVMHDSGQVSLEHLLLLRHPSQSQPTMSLSTIRGKNEEEGGESAPGLRPGRMLNGAGAIQGYLAHKKSLPP